MKEKITFTLCFLFLMSGMAMAQSKNVRGKVTSSDDGSGLATVTVTVKGTNVATQTDLNGDYSINVSADQTLVFTSVGFTSHEELVGDRSVINVSLDIDLQQLQEVIVTGVAGATERRKLTVSVTRVGAEKLTIAPASSLSSALTGKVAGLKSSGVGGAPGQQADMLLRGDNALNRNSQPLIVIDGVIMNGSLADINVDDVEAMEVIKGAAASSLFGSRAGAGVISITTKRGKGLAQGATNISVRNEYGFQNLQHYLEIAQNHPYELASDWQSVQGQYTKYDGVTFPAGFTGSYNPNVSGTRTIKADGYMDNPYGVYRYAPQNVFKTGNNMVNHIALAHRTDKSNIYLSFENNSQEGVVRERDGYERQNFRFNIDQTINSWLRLSASNLFINRKVQPPANIFYAVARMEPDVDLFEVNPDGQPYNLRINHHNGEVTNPLYALYKQKNRNHSRRWMGNYTANFKFADWVNLDVTQTMEIENYRSEVVSPKDTWTVSGVYNNGSLSQNSNEQTSQNTQMTFNLGHRFGDLEIKSKLSYLYENRTYEGTSVGSSQFRISGIEEFNNFASINSAGSSKTKERAQNYFAILGLDYKDRYLFDGMFRYDGSSLFGPDSRWNPYYRVSAAYRISEDVSIPGIDELKVRIANGTAGIRPDFSWQYEVYTLSSGVATASQKGNTALKPSKTTETEYGLNVEFLKKFTMEAVYAHSKTTDQFLNVPLIAFMNDGFNRQWQNAGTIQSNTIEVSLNARWLNNENFSWNSDLVFSRVRQKITELPVPEYWLDPPSGDVNAVRIREGESYGAIYGHRMVRTLDEMSRQLPAGASISDYAVNSEGYVIPAGSEGTRNELPVLYRENGDVWLGKIGDGNSDFNIGFANTFNWKGFQLYVLVDWKQGGDIYNSNDQRLAFNLVSKRMDMGGVPDGQKKAYTYWFAGMYDGNFANEYWVEDGSYIKLREVAIGYTVPQSAMRGFLGGAVKGITFKAVGRNLHTFTGYSGYDPEVGTLRQPIDGIGANPIYRNIALSLGFNF